jgi:hypothetical protein
VSRLRSHAVAASLAALALAACSQPVRHAAAPASEYVVSPLGDDAAPGTAAAPFRTLERARAAVRVSLVAGLTRITVWLRGGVYERTGTFQLGPRDSGERGAPVIWRAWPGETPRLLGGRRLDLARLAPVPEASAAWTRLDPVARGHVLQLALREQGVSDFGTLATRGSVAHAALELFEDGVPLRLARWPDAGAEDPPISVADEVLLVGDGTPPVGGRYVKVGTSDGVSSFRRDGPVDGRDWYLWRTSRPEGAGAWTVWYLSPSASGPPALSDPCWIRWSGHPVELGRLMPSQGATGSFAPVHVRQGFAAIPGPVTAQSFGWPDRAARWLTAPDPWFHGYFTAPWADLNVAGTLDPATRTIQLAKAMKKTIVAGQPFYAFNLLEELTEPGEWYLDRALGVLYLWPLADPASTEIVATLLDGPIFRLAGASDVTLRGLSLEATRAELVRVEGGARVTLDELVLRNAGTTAVSLTGHGHRLSRSEVVGSGGGGVAVQGGDRRALAPGGNVVEASHFHHLGRFTETYQPAVRLDGVGHEVRNNLVHDLPHAAILFAGDEHVVELNEIHRVCGLTSDAGAIYGGRDWGARGNFIRHNYLHDLATRMDGEGLVVGIYLDDCLSGVRVEGNLLHRVAGTGLLLGGGRDNVVANNLFARCDSAVVADSRGATWPVRPFSEVPGSSWNLLEKLLAVGYRDQPRRSRYPECAAIPDTWAAILAAGASWTQPEGNVFRLNAGFANTRWIDAAPETIQRWSEVAGNAPDIDPRFSDEAAGDLTLRPDSPLLQLPGFQLIPLDRTGLPR